MSNQTPDRELSTSDSNLSPASGGATEVQSRVAAYKRPPVHEVIHGLSFSGSLDSSVLETLLPRLAARLPKTTRLEQVGLELGFGPAGASRVVEKRTFEGWQLSDETPSRVLRVTPTLVTAHFVRPGKWPSGPYAGWESLAQDYAAMLGPLEDVYSGLQVERFGLRYLNRLALPEGTEYFDWLKIGLQAPSPLDSIVGFNLRQTWQGIGGDSSLSATIGLASIQIEDQAIAKGNVGVLLDIEVFAASHELALSNALEWFKRAHLAERELFESCITDRLRETFR